ncbi:MAG: leucine-rich repeat protein [Firmicutes bacterium]|nr:leucine-rich repeat protein [Bacillota bacterium]
MAIANGSKYKVTTINAKAFANATMIETIAFPSTLTTINLRAFIYCSNLKKVTIPSGVTQINVAVFSYCTNLTEVNLPSTLTQIGNDAFRGCSKLQTMTIPAKVTAVGSTAFRDCSSLKSLTFLGNAPTYGTDTLRDVNSSFCSYYYSGKSGWGSTWAGYPCQCLNGEPETQEETEEEFSEETTQQITTQATSEATTYDDETVEMPTEEPTEPTTFEYDENGFAGYYDDLGQYIEVYQPCELDSESNKYLITNAGNLYWFADYINSGLGMDSGVGAILMNDIIDNPPDAMNGTNTNVRLWTPISAAGGNGYFGVLCGDFEGRGHIISGLYCDSKSDSPLTYAGLFGSISSQVSVTNVCVTNSYFKGSSGAGAIVGTSWGTLNNCVSADNTIISFVHAGGIAGITENDAMTIGCHCMDSNIFVNNTDLETLTNINGIVGHPDNYLPENCFFNNVTMTKALGDAVNKWNGATEIPDGDVTLDGKVDIMDAIAVQSLVYNDTTKYSIIHRSGDMNNDKAINDFDTASILKAIFEQTDSQTNEEQIS